MIIICDNIAGIAGKTISFCSERETARRCFSNVFELAKAEFEKGERPHVGSSAVQMFAICCHCWGWDAIVHPRGALTALFVLDRDAADASMRRSLGYREVYSTQLWKPYYRLRSLDWCSVRSGLRPRHRSRVTFPAGTPYPVPWKVLQLSFVAFLFVTSHD